MTDLEITRLCAEASGIELFEGNRIIRPDKLMDRSRVARSAYKPLSDDAQCFSLLLLLLTSGKHVSIENNALLGKNYGKWPILAVGDAPPTVYEIRTPETFRRAVCCAVAKMQEAK